MKSAKPRDKEPGRGVQTFNLTRDQLAAHLKAIAKRPGNSGKGRRPRKAYSEPADEPQPSEFMLGTTRKK